MRLTTKGRFAVPALSDAALPDGYTLARPMSEITVADIVVAVDEPMDARQCEGKEDCKGGQKCMTHHLWMDLNRKMFNYLSSVSLADLVREQNQRNELHESAQRLNKRKTMMSNAAV